MAKQIPDDQLSEERRKEIYHALVEPQDIHDFTVPAHAACALVGRSGSPSPRNVVYATSQARRR